MSAEIYNENEILLCLKNTYTSPDKNIRTQSEEKLSTLINSNIINFSSYLIELFKKEKDKNLRLSIILFLKRKLSEKAENNILSKDDLNSLIQIYILIMVDQNISIKELNNLKDTFIILLSTSSIQMLSEIINYIQKQISLLPLGSINGVISILSSLINSSLLNSKDTKLFYSIYSSIITMVSDITQNLYNKYSTIDLNKINIEDYKKLNNIFYYIYELIFDCNLKAKKNIDKTIIDENISQKLYNLYIIGVKLLVDLNAKDNNRIISWTGQKHLDKNVNNMKINIFKYINFRINEINEYSIDQTKIDNYNQMIKIVMLNLEWLILNKFSYLIKIETSDFNIEYPDYSYTILITFMLIHLKRILSKTIFLQEYTSQFKSIYKNILLPLLIPTEIEEQSASDNDSVNGYLIDMNDVIYENKQKKIKSQIGGLIKKFYEKNNECHTFMFKYTINIIFSLYDETKNLSDKSLFEENDIITLLIESNTINKEKIICASFLALNIFSGIELKKIDKENYKLLDSLFRYIFPLIKYNENVYPLLKYQMIIFIRNYIINLYQNDKLILEKIIKFLFDGLFNTQNQLISNSSSDTIQKFFEFKIKSKHNEIDMNEEEEENEFIEENNKINNVRNSLINIILNISSEFERQILETHISNFFDILSQIILSFVKNNENFFKNILVNICQRIKLEVEKHLKVKFVVQKDIKNKKEINKNSHEIIINKCFNIIKILIHNHNFAINNSILIENSLRPLMEYMKDLEKIKFDEDLIYIIYMLIKQKKEMKGLGFSIIKYLSKYIDKCGSLYMEVYQLIDKCLLYGSNQILSLNVWYNGIFNAFMSGIKGDKYNKGILYTCMLIQTWITQFDKLPTDNINLIFEEIITKTNIILNDTNNKKNISKNIYNLLGFITTIISGLNNYENIIIPLLRKYHNESSLKRWLKILIKHNNIFFDYEIKILIYSLCSIIKKGLIQDDIHIIINLGLDLLKCQTMNCKYQTKKDKINNIESNFIEEDEEDNKDEENDEDDEEDNELKEYKIIIDETSNPIKNLDEFQLYGEMLKYLKSEKNDIYSKWENSLTQDQKQKIMKLIATKRISIHSDDNNNNIVVARRIVSIKRNPDLINEL